MSITPEELAEKRSFIKTGMEFIVPSRHVQSGQYLVRVTSVSTINKTSCWGEYQKDIVHFEERVLVPDNHYADRCMSLVGFIEYVYSKRQIAEV